MTQFHAYAEFGSNVDALTMGHGCSGSALGMKCMLAIIELDAMQRRIVAAGMKTSCSTNLLGSTNRQLEPPL